MNRFFMLAMGVFFSLSLLAEECSDIIIELQAMKKAQSAIQMSLINNHSILAETMESYAEALSATAGRAHKTVSSNMLGSANSFRQRGEKAHKTALKLDQATHELIQKISKCLK